MPPKQTSSDFLVFHGSVDAEKSSQTPSIILLLGWMDAPLSLLSKYVDGHRSLFPTATIVLVKSHSAFLWTSAAAHERALQPVIDILLDGIYRTAEARPSNGGLLVHALSNAGGIQLMTLAGIIERRLKEKRERWVALSTITMAFVIDSTPGSNEYESIMTTFTISINSPILKGALRLPLTLVYIAYYLINNVLFNNPTLLPLLHRYLEQRRLLPGCDDETPRLYVYSDVDAMVPSASVDRHLSRLLAKKIPFAAEKYIGTQHVSHVRQDSKRYWGAVEEVWGRALRQREGTRPKGKL
ncbi:hypothetical protein GALMADRAFT_270744 [Galerina marginata CBS 339.88]|uniref:DUF829 domain-containing protein n=1 Tax=Galerina marginata (strain CBS 339.88) TaxID=685588 RepID=A0A067SMX2_GALM3|nr:hypothetical protein GALMADRAFT_270744 [Galerina marginata CBS 339.88]